MAETNETGCLTTAAEDDAAEALLLQHVLLLHPAQATVEELVREIEGEGATFAQRDAIQRAVRDLAAAGLLHHRDGFVLPTRATLRFSELLGR